MAHIKWTDDLNTHIQVIDNQHIRIVEYINMLDDISGTHDRTQVEKVLNELVDYTLSHFAFEESLMEDAGYSFINGHKRVHQLFVKRVGDFQQRFKIGEDIVDELLVTLKSWLINHIRSDDNDYVAIVKSSMENINTSSGDGWLKKSVKKFFG
jgi:hemerythrin